MARYREATLQEARCYADVMQARRAEQQAHRERRWWQRPLPVPTVAERAAKLKTEAARVGWEDAQATQKKLAVEVRQWSAGIDGEEAFDKTVEGHLSDDWLLLGGYRNSRGEIDKTLVGPGGLWIVEVKNINAWIHVSGKRWIHERLDANGLPVRTKATDRTGRTWGQMVNDVAEGLDLHLQQNGVVIPIRTAVVFTHPEALVLSNRDADVDLVGRPAALLHAMKTMTWPMSSESALAVAELIRSHHRDHDNRRSS